ncbi:unnamed protein product [Rhizoctonia solani]|uniref:Uncharacterized protein n=1 Tax=Rhizoctonia solani TaxID=456999 RepID=A0A8H2XJD8_9AGAM|nr:unnamed protein product [Rhizoctonia solani]
MFQLSKKLFVLTLVCLTIVFYSSLYPSIAPLGRLPSRGDKATPSPTVTVPGPPVLVSASVPASTPDPHPDPPTRSEGLRITFLIQELTAKLFSFLARSYRHSRLRILISRPAPTPTPTRTIPVFILPSRTVGRNNPALPTPGHVSTLGTRVQVEEPVYIQPLPRDDVPKARLGSQYFVFGSFYHIKNSSWLVPGLFAMLVGAIVVLEALTRLETLRPTMEAQPRALAQATLNHQVANTNAPGSNKVSFRFIKSEPVVILGVQLVASLTLTMSNGEAFICTSSNSLICRASNINLWLDAIIARGLPVLEELCANLGSIDIVHSSIHTTAYTLEANVLDTWGIDGTQDCLSSRWSIQTHPQTTRTPRSHAHPRSQIPSLVAPRTSTHTPSRSVHMYSSWTAQNSAPSLSLMCNCRPCRNQITCREWNTVVRPSINWYILGLIARNFSTSLRLLATSVPPSVERGGSFIVSSRAPFECLDCVSRLSLDHHLVTLLVKSIVVPDSTFALLLFGRSMPTKCTGGSPLCRGLLIGWVPQAVDSPVEVTTTPDFNPVVVEHRVQQAIRPGYGVYRPPSVQSTPNSQHQLEHAGRQRVLEHVEQDARVTEAQTHPDEGEPTEGSRRRTRRGGRRVKERKERRGALAQAAGN